MDCYNSVDDDTGKASIKSQGDKLQQLVGKDEPLDENSKKRARWIPKAKRNGGMSAEEAMKTATESNSTGGVY